MPLDEREQRILDEIERQFREEDPDLVERVNTMPLARFARGNVRVGAIGVVAGLVLLLATFAVNQFLAWLGFIVMVASLTQLVTAIRGSRKTPSADDAEPSGREISAKLRKFWPFGR